MFAALTLIALPAMAQNPGKHFGEPFTDAKAVTLGDAMKNVEKYANKQIKVEGEIRDVCQTKGCWLVVTDGEHAMRVTFKAYSFFVPKDAVGKKVVLEGTVAKETIDEDRARHFAEESKQKVDVSKIKGPQVTVTLIASGVQIAE
jgi:hypothetical protein